jgi:hypothetical protein
VWMDADAVPLDMALRWEAVATLHPTAHLLLSADVSSLANSGTVLVRNSKHGKRLLQLWLKQRTDAHGRATRTDQV